MKHTPGTWKAHKKTDPVGYANWEIHFSEDGECVTDGVYEEADARLIASAPDLLEACQLALMYFDAALVGSQTGDALREAIAKAKGEVAV